MADKLTKEEAHKLLEIVTAYRKKADERDDLIKELQFMAEMEFAEPITKPPPRIPWTCKHCGRNEYDYKLRVLPDGTKLHPYICWRKR
jgi:hypothetical protein